MKTKNTYAVMGATGHIGQTLVQDLLKKGYAVRALGRDSKKLSELKKYGAETFSFPFDSSSDLAKFFADTTAVFTMLPPAYSEKDFYSYQTKVSDAIASAITKSNVKYVVNMSSVGAQHSDGTGIIKAHYYNEQQLNKIQGLNVVHIRAPFFMENFFFASSEMESKGFFSWSYRKDLSVPFVAASDIAKKVFDFFENLSFSKSSVFEVYGPENMTFDQAASYFSKSYQRPITYKQNSYSEDEKNMVSFGMKPDSASLMVEFNRAMNDGRISYTQKQSPQNTCTTTFYSFANQFFNKKKAA